MYSRTKRFSFAKKYFFNLLKWAQWAFVKTASLQNLLNRICFFFQTNCSFTVNSNLSSTSIGDYAVALQIEDFTDSSSSIPLSSVPLQFIITVQQAGVCFDSAVFVSPTPAAGETLLAQNRSLQLNARAYVHYTK